MTKNKLLALGSCKVVTEGGAALRAQQTELSAAHQGNVFIQELPSLGLAGCTDFMSDFAML